MQQNPTNDMHTLEETSIAVKAFRTISRSFALFHLIFLFLLTAEIVLFLLFFPFFTKATIIAYSIATIVLTIFSYFVLKFYIAAKKPEQLLSIRDQYIEKCKRTLSHAPSDPEYYLSMVRICYRLISELHLQEYQFCILPKKYTTLSSLAEKLSACLHWQDTHKLREITLFLAAREAINFVKAHPTDLEAHACLAGAYRALSKLYLSPTKQGMHAHLPWISKAYEKEEMIQKFQQYARRALEEYNIMNEYAPNDPWVHTQLASIYHDLEDVENEIKAYECLYALNPKDSEILFRLGSLYFSKGKNAKGLRVYEQLREENDGKDALLLSLYDSIEEEELSF